MGDFLKKYNLYLAWIVSIIATGGSLYFSEGMKFIPCSWCWYQRILMYPLVFLLGRAAIKGDRNIIPYILPLSMLGTLIGTVHYLEQKVGLFGDACRSLIPCSTQYINWAGFITIPFLSLVAFMLITILLSLNKKNT
ncbi:disulfide oxidoreductase [Bacillus sp. B15-48]|uniref:disulfide oxidoreductase n=1 Tax=Bacillus sp. B15-48 TaxID=1548601 RepID=UPI00193F3A99|nr:disulfide oxidoreductase [Bacillus sp. B15-48]MBM4761035.1 disulfide bond formation protein B [Bacillus sp. B15-48]